MHESNIRLIALLADGAFHSGEDLGQALGISRAAIWKLVKGLKSMGLEVHAVSGKGYRLAGPLELFDTGIITAQLDTASRVLLERIEVHPVIASTNAYLMQAAATGMPGGVVCLAEYQESGRGRRGRQWIAPYGGNIPMSLLWRFQDGTGGLGGLSLAIAVAVLRALTECGLHDAGLKWPNDILVNGKKLAGILLEVAGENNGPCYAAIGVGVNFDMSPGGGAAIDQPWTDLHRCGVTLGRNVVAGKVLHHLLLAIPQYLSAGLEAFHDEWNKWDLTRDRSVMLLQGERKRYGIARGIDSHGLLQVEEADGIRGYSSGEISIRTAD